MFVQELQYILTGFLKPLDKACAEAIKNEYGENKVLSDKEDRAFHLGRRFGKDRYSFPAAMSGIIVMGTLSLANIWLQNKMNEPIRQSQANMITNQSNSIDSLQNIINNFQKQDSVQKASATALELKP